MRQVELAAAIKCLSGVDVNGNPQAMVKISRYRIEKDKATGEQTHVLADKIVEPNVRAAFDVKGGQAVIAVVFNDERNYEKCAELIEAANEKRENGCDSVFVKVRDMKTQQICVEMQLSNCMMFDARRTVMFISDEEDIIAYIEEDDRDEHGMKELDTHEVVKELFTQFSRGEVALVTMQHHRIDNGRAVNEARVATQQIGLRYQKGVFEVSLSFDSFADEGYRSISKMIDDFSAAVARDGYKSYGLRLFVTNGEQKRVVMFSVGHMKFDNKIPMIVMTSPVESTMGLMLVNNTI